MWIYKSFSALNFSTTRCHGVSSVVVLDGFLNAPFVGIEDGVKECISFVKSVFDVTLPC